MQDANYAVVGSCGYSPAGGEGTAVNVSQNAPQTASSCRILLKDSGGGGDRDYVNVVFFR